MPDDIECEAVNAIRGKVMRAVVAGLRHITVQIRWRDAFGIETIKCRSIADGQKCLQNIKFSVSCHYLDRPFQNVFLLQNTN